MVIVQLRGGLGNQMFQYALARHMAHINHSRLKLDISSFQDDAQRSYHLSCFRIQERFASPEEIAATKSKKQARTGRSRASRLLQIVGLKRRWLSVRERHFHFDPSMLELRGNIYLAYGYWQSQKYFEPIEALLRKEFTFRHKPDSVNLEYIEQIQGCDSVSLHVRRSDYATNPRTRAIHGLMPLEYYKQALEKISQTVSQPQIFVFSDDPDWVEEHMQFGYPVTVIRHNRDREQEDLRLMSWCKYHIIANSSFSWWGAWLCTYPGKIVCAPNRWLADQQHNTKDIIPEAWHRL